MKKLLFLALILLWFQAGAQKKTKTENIILVTLDGMRWQEIFNGADLNLASNKQFVHDSAGTASLAWGKSPAERREKLLPFIWGEVAGNGQLYGNRALGNKVNTMNKMWFSYPGYNEILTGAADDAHINSNDLASAHYTDDFLKTLWNYIESQPAYKGKTSLIITTDHGRGHSTESDWRDHGSKVKDADQIWFAIIGPDTPGSGEMKGDGQFYQNQIAKTLAALLGIDYNNEHKPGDIILQAIKY